MTISFGLLGAGRIGKTHATAILGIPGTKLAAVFDPIDAAADHIVQGISLSRARAQRGPDLHPFSGLLVNLLFADFQRYFFNERITRNVGVYTRASVGHCYIRKNNLQNHRAEQITASRYKGRNAFSKVGITVEINLL